MRNLKGRKVSKNIEDLRDPKDAAKYETKRKMGVYHRDNVFNKGGSKIITKINNKLDAENPMYSRIPRLMKDKPQTKPKNMQTFKKK